MEDKAPKLDYVLYQVLDDFVESKLITEKQKKAFETEVSYRNELGLMDYTISQNYYDFLKSYLKKDNDYCNFLYDLAKIYPEYNRYDHDSKADKKNYGEYCDKKARFIDYIGQKFYIQGYKDGCSEWVTEQSRIKINKIVYDENFMACFFIRWGK